MAGITSGGVEGTEGVVGTVGVVGVVGVAGVVGVVGVVGTAGVVGVEGVDGDNGEDVPSGGDPGSTVPGSTVPGVRVPGTSDGATTSSIVRAMAARDATAATGKGRANIRSRREWARVGCLVAGTCARAAVNLSRARCRASGDGSNPYALRDTWATRSRGSSREACSE